MLRLRLQACRTGDTCTLEPMLHRSTLQTCLRTRRCPSQGQAWHIRHPGHSPRPCRRVVKPHRQPIMTRHALAAEDLGQFWYPVALSTLAGLSTTIGGVLAVIRRPSQSSMAGLLGIAIGVMATISIVELIVKNAMENDPFLVLASAGGGALAYYVLEPFFPKVEEEDFLKKQQDGPAEPTAKDSESAPRKKVRKAVGSGARNGLNPAGSGGLMLDPETQPLASASNSQYPSPETGSPRSEPVVTSPARTALVTVGTARGPVAAAEAEGSLGPAVSARDPAATGEAHLGPRLGSEGGVGATSIDVNAGPHAAWISPSHSPHSASLMRLGILMAITMTLHNMPEGFAVAFSAFTDFGPVMAVAIALHNIPEGVIIAAPLYAATNSRWKAVGVATASGLSEPLGAVLALLLLRPFITEDRLQYMLACVGGLMLAVCIIELWPEARACRNDRALALGVIGGSILMGWTLAVEG